MIGELIPTGVTFGTGRNSINDMFSGTAEFNNVILDSGADFSGGTGGGILYSGGTDLYNIFGTGGGGSTTAGNGLTKTGDNITLGGALTANTTIDTAGYDFKLLDTDVEVFMDSTTDAKTFKIVGSAATLTQFSTGVDAPTFGGTAGLAIGAIGESAVIGGIVPERGQTGDTFIYSSAAAHGLNVISATGTGTDDYIRFYAGIFANGGTAHLHMQGSGGTKGYIGLNNESPQYRLDVNGSLNADGPIYSAGTDLYNIFGTGGGGSTTAGNGLTKTGDNITLGGSLTANTEINLSGFDISLVGGNVGINTSPSTAFDISGLTSMRGQVGSDTLSPHLEIYHNTQVQPVAQYQHWSSDNISISSGLYWDSGSWRNSDTGSNFQIYKWADAFRFNYGAGGTLGNAATIGGGFALTNTGDLKIGGFTQLGTVTATEKVDIDGNIIVRGTANITGDTMLASSGGTIYSAGTDLYNIFGAGGSGESNTASSVGGGNSLFKQKTGVDLEFRSLSAGTDIIITTGDTITINAGNTTFDYGTADGVVDWDVKVDSPTAKIILSGNVTLNVLNATDGRFGTLKIQQDGTGSHTLTLGAGTHKVANGGSGSITLTSTPNAIDIINFFYDGSEFNWSAGYNFT